MVATTYNVSFKYPLHEYCMCYEISRPQHKCDELPFWSICRKMSDVIGFLLLYVLCAAGMFYMLPCRPIGVSLSTYVAPHHTILQYLKGLPIANTMLQ